MGEYADDRWSWTARERHWSEIVGYCRKKTPYSYRTKNERAFSKFINRPIDYGDF